ncbi:MAG TPA: chemotaxis protein CheW, partial [Candidatus Acidoferrum sp.]|nr:chemotaxis protein CheW [Candidatus Acidoferrum sp.]
DAPTPESAGTSAPAPTLPVELSPSATEAVPAAISAPPPKPAPVLEKSEAAKPKKPKQELTAKRLGGALVQKANLRPEDVLRALEMQQAGDPRRLGEILVELGLVTPQQIEDIVRQNKPEEPKEAAIRVDVNLLEKQMNLVSELVLLRNRLLQIAAEANERNLNAAVHGLNYVTSELRKNVMKTRMQPVGQLFDKLPRIVRDISKDLGKKIRLETQGGDTELDKTLLEAIKDPVTHILRNSIDHGIESPEQRATNAKLEEGIVRLHAFHEGGNFHLEISDDGAGIDARRVMQKAVSKSLLSAAQAEKLNETEMLNLIFLPGLSTAEKVTNVSGRGVGMDVVKTNIERIGGRAKLESIRGRGTTVHLEIPLTLATIPALTVVSGTSVFAIPQAALVEMIGLDVENAPNFIESIDGTSVFRFRGTVLPLLSLREELKLQDAPPSSSTALNIVVVRSEGRQIALQLDAVRGTEEIVIKPLDKRFKVIALYSGAAVLGDGRVALILDIAAVARRAGMIARQQTKTDQLDAGQRKLKLTLLLLVGPDDERMAMPLDRVQRLEEFDANAKERLAGRFVMQYRGDIIPVVELWDLLEERRKLKRHSEPGADNAPRKISAVVVKSEDRRTVILEVHGILGIAKVEIEALNPPSRAGVRGTLVVQDRVTELLEMETLLARMKNGTAPGEEFIAAGGETHDGH